MLNDADMLKQVYAFINLVDWIIHLFIPFEEGLALKKKPYFQFHYQ